MNAAVIALSPSSVYQAKFVLMSSWLESTHALLRKHRRPEQSGFTAGRSAMDAILALRLLSEIHREFNQPLHVAYVDLKSAFDSVDRMALLQSLRGIGVPQFLVRLIEDLHDV